MASRWRAKARAPATRSRPARTSPAASSAPVGHGHRPADERPEPLALRLLRAAPVDWLVVGLGNPGDEYAGTRHNAGFEVVEVLARRWQLDRSRERYRALLREGRAGPGGPRVALLEPRTYMNEAGRSVGPARGAYRLPLERLLVVHDEIDLPFGEIRTKLGGGVAGHNGLRSLRHELGGGDFARVRVGVGRPDTTDPEIVSSHVLGRFREPPDEVRALIDRAADVTVAVVLGDREL